MITVHRCSVCGLPLDQLGERLSCRRCKSSTTLAGIVEKVVALKQLPIGSLARVQNEAERILASTWPAGRERPDALLTVALFVMLRKQGGGPLIMPAELREAAGVSQAEFRECYQVFDALQGAARDDQTKPTRAPTPPPPPLRQKLGDKATKADQALERQAGSINRAAGRRNGE